MKKGFTLVEVLIGTALLLSLMVGLISLTQLSVRSSQVSLLRTDANLLLQKTMEAVMAVRASNFGSLDEGVYHPALTESGWFLVAGKERVGTIERWVEISRVQREIACGGERVCPIVASGGVVDPVTFMGKAVVSWQELGQEKQESLESLLTFWR